MTTKTQGQRKYLCGCFGPDKTGVSGSVVQELCPLHKAAPKLLKAVKYAVDAIDSTHDVESGDAKPPYYESLRAVIAEAEMKR